MSALRKVHTDSMNILQVVICLVIVCFIGPMNVYAVDGGRIPLLMEGKRTLYQRVLTRPGAQVFTIPNASADKSDIPVFSVLYVYDRLAVNNATWVEVGAGNRGEIDGWMKSNQVIDWKQSIVVSFGNSAGRNRMLFFRDRKFARNMLESENAIGEKHKLISQIVLEKTDNILPIVSIEPENYIDIEEQFYLLPIMETEQILFSSGFTSRLLKVASVSANAKVPENGRDNSSKKSNSPQKNVDSKSSAQNDSGSLPTKGDDFNRGNEKRRHDTAIAFVIDATKSMGPYIDEARDVAGRILDSLDEVGIGGHVSFALVGFRDNINKVPELEYVSRIFTLFQNGADSKTFRKLARQLEPATASSIGFVEDAYAGISTAINELEWEGFAAKYIVLITDAGPRDAGDPLGKTGMNAEGVRQLALDNGIAIYALHLLTPEGKHTHPEAAARLRSVSNHPKGSLYYAVPAGERKEFRKVIDRISKNLVRHIQMVASGQDTLKDFAQAADDLPKNDSELGRLAKTMAKVGYAMRLAYLGKIEGTEAPSIFEGWVADRDVSHPKVPALEVRILLTKNQLSDLQEALRAIIEAGEKGQLSPEDFFEEIRSAAAVLSRDPTKVGRGAFKNLADSGLLGEYLEGLPYRSNVMNVTEDLWLSWSIGQQEAFLDEIEAKIRLYTQYHDDVNRWIDLSHKNIPGEAVYPVTLDSLP